MPPENHGDSKRSPRFDHLYDGIKKGVPGVARLLLVGPSLGLSIQVRQRAEYDWIVVVKQTTSGEGPVVLFGVGVGPVEALLHADGQVQAGRWREDKPWEGK